MKEFVVEKSVKIPPIKRAGRPRSKFTLAADALKVGESFVVKTLTDSQKNILYSVLGKKNGKNSKKFVYRTVDNGHRVWRVK